ncbi:glycosyltransferase family 9 protein [soil metagenome]
MITGDLRTRLLPIVARRVRRPAITGNRRLLILQPDHLGDIILSEPAVRLLRAMLPDWQLIAIVGPWSAEIAEMAWPVDRIVTVEFPGFSRAASSTNPLQAYAYLRRQASLLRSLGADDAVVLRDDAWWCAWLARASVGASVVTSDDHRTRRFATITSGRSGSTHRTAVAMAIVTTYISSFGLNVDAGLWDMSPKIRLATGSEDGIERHLQRQAIRRPRVALHPGSGAPVKTWPVEHWKMLIRSLGDFDVILSGSTSEQPLCEAIAEGFPHATSVAGTTTLRELASLMSTAAVAVGTDNGPMHLAGALGIPTVRLFGPSNPDRYGPWPGTRGQLVIQSGWTCPRCEDLSAGRPAGCGCMLAITPERVFDVLRKALNRAA